nr:helix-turn-helix transcriptional regulator [uncultured Sulfurimonas sp.]
MENCDENKRLELFYKQIGKNIKKLRTSKGFTQLKLANAMGYDSVGHIAKAELYKYEKKFNLEHLFKICSILEVSMSEVFEDTEKFLNNSVDKPIKI